MFEVILVPGHQRDSIRHGGGGDDRIPQLHLLLLVQMDRLLDHLIIERVDQAGVDDVENRGFLLW